MSPKKNRCPVCEGDRATLYSVAKDYEFYSSNDEFTYLECGGCGSIYLDDPPTNRLREIYPSNYYSQDTKFTDSFLFRIKNWIERRMFRRFLSNLEGDRLAALDVGGGVGWMLSAVKAADPRVTETAVVDLDESARAAAEKAGHSFYAGPIESFTTDRKYDFILMLNLIEHVADPKALLRRLPHLLKPGGKVLIKTPNIDTWDRFLFRRTYWGGLHAPRHFVLFSRESFEVLARECGLAISEFSYTQGSPQWTGSIFGTLAKYGLVDISARRPMYKHPLCGLVYAATAAFDFLRLPFSATAQMFITLTAAQAKPVALGKQDFAGSMPEAARKARA